jgi:hypothetical protein
LGLDRELGLELGLELYCILLCFGSSWALGSGIDHLEGWRGSMESERLYYGAGMFTNCLILGIQFGTNHLEEGKGDYENSSISRRGVWKILPKNMMKTAP